MKAYLFLLSLLSIINPVVANNCSDPITMSAIRAPPVDTPREICSDVQSQNWYSVFRGLTPYSHKPATEPLVNGMPDYFVWGNRNYAARPSTMTDCELEQAHLYCIDRINKYRQGVLSFSNGNKDVTALPLLRTSAYYESCSSAEALGDLVVTYVGRDTGQVGGCVGAHANAFKCPRGLYYTGQNTCCSNGDMAWGTWDNVKYTTLQRIMERIDACFQAMWDEGQGVDPDCCNEDCSSSGGPSWHQIGHWCNMRDKNNVYVSCGFGFTEEGRIVVNQNFGTAFAPLPTPSPVPTSSPVPSTSNPTYSRNPTYSPTSFPIYTLPPTNKPSRKRPKRHDVNM